MLEIYVMCWSNNDLNRRVSQHTEIMPNITDLGYIITIFVLDEWMFATTVLYQPHTITHCWKISRAYTNSDTDFSLQIVCNLCIWKTSQESLIIQPRYKQKLHSDWFIEITGLFSSHLKLPIRPRAPFSTQWMNPEALLRIPVCVCTRTMHTINPMSWEMLPYFETPQSSGNLQHTLNDVPLQSGFEHMRNKTTIFHSCQACDAYEKILRFSKLRWYSHTIGSRLHFFFSSGKIHL